MSALSSVKSKFDPEEVAGWSRDKRLAQLREHFSTGHSDIIRTTSHTKTGSGFPAAEVINATTNLGRNIIRQAFAHLAFLFLSLLTQKMKGRQLLLT